MERTNLVAASRWLAIPRFTYDAVEAVFTVPSNEQHANTKGSKCVIELFLTFCDPVSSVQFFSFFFVDTVSFED